MLAHPIRRWRLVASKGVAIGGVVLVVALGAWVGMIAGVAIGGGGISFGHITAFALSLTFFGLAAGAVALAIGAGTGRRSLATGVAAGVGITSWLIYGFAPLVSAIGWLKYLSFFYYYADHDPLTRGVGVADIVVLAVVTAVIAVLGLVGIQRRDLRG